MDQGAEEREAQGARVARGRDEEGSGGRGRRGNGGGVEVEVIWVDDD